jgi:hypothetical protein
VQQLHDETHSELQAGQLRPYRERQRAGFAGPALLINTPTGQD